MDRDDDLARAEAELVRLDGERAGVLARIDALRSRESQPLSADERVALFASLFRGREDVYALRWERASTKRSGYAPACRNEWVAGVCEKPRVRCGACPNQSFRPLTDAVLRAHLQGQVVVGLYPLRSDERCSLVAIDLDGAGWRADARAIREAAVELGVPITIERSRSGDGAHGWVFFSEPVAAVDARRLAFAVLTEASARHPTIALASYDRVFPSQDVMPTGGFGNLIALPLQRAAREHGFSVFLDDTLEPYTDQWSHLAAIERLSRERLNALLGIAARREGGVLGVASDEEPDQPWKAQQPAGRLSLIGGVPAVIAVTIRQQLYIPRAALPARLVDRIRRLAAFSNPVFHERQRLRLAVGHVPRVIGCAEEHPNHIALPRGLHDDLAELIARSGSTITLDDQRVTGTPIDAAFTGQLSDDQQRAVDVLLRDDCGVLVAPPGSGKTVIAAALIARRATTTLVLVSSRALVEQWRARLATFLTIDPKDVGTIHAGRRKPSGIIDIAMIQSLARAADVDEVVERYGFVIVDECHHVPAVTTEQVTRRAPARYWLGLTATPQRRDGHQPIIRMQCGPTRHTIRQAPDLTLTLVRRQTRTRITVPDGAAIQTIYAELAHDTERNAMIVTDARAAIGEGRSVLILTGRIDHLHHLDALLRPHVVGLVSLHGGLKPRERRDALAALADSSDPVAIIATGRYLGEGFDHPRLDTLLLALPVAWKGTITQYAGRLHRPASGKHDARIYDYIDSDTAVLQRMYEKRERTYRALGYTIT
jgi:superfamily II DNA or RNA helicase